MLGLFAFFYATLHLLTYVVLDQGLAFEFILPDIVKRPYITMGMMAFMLMVPLAITSTKGWIRRLGQKWQLLHRLVYFSAIAACLHFLWKVKVVIGEPVYYAVILACAAGVPAAVAAPADGPAAPGRGWGFHFLKVPGPPGGSAGGPFGALPAH